MSLADRFATLRKSDELFLLQVALPSTLLFRVQSDHPDAILLAGGNEYFARVGNRSALREVFSHTPTVLMAEKPGAAMVRSAARMQIYSVIPSEVSTQQVVAAISATLSGFAVTVPLPSSGPSEAATVTEELTAREVEVLRLIARGYRNKQVAASLNISQHTAKYHVSAVISKLGARTRTEAVTIGVMRGLVAI